MSGAKRLIVNADDLGRSAAVNRGVLEAHRRGILTSASLSVNFPDAAEVPALGQDAPGLGIGLHLTFTGTLAVLPAERVATLAGPGGALPESSEALDRARPEDVLAEARAQLRRFRELMGRDPTHLDTRAHAYRRPPVLEAVLTLAWETGLPVRNASADVHERLRREGIRCTDRVTTEIEAEAASLDALVAFVAGLPLGTTELACHPALGEDAASRGGTVAALTHREARQTVQAAGVRLIHFGDL